MLSPQFLTSYIAASCAIAVTLVLYTGNPPDRGADNVNGVSEPSVMVLDTRIASFSQPLAAVQSTHSAQVDKQVSLELAEASANWRVATPHEIPFPLYPNGTRYRIGGKNGMKLALFETTDDFQKVDAFYGRQASDNGLSRKMLTTDYVEYSMPAQVTTDDWKVTDTSGRPGVVIHEFFDANDAENLGADRHSRTNIIISFR